MMLVDDIGGCAIAIPAGPIPTVSVDGGHTVRQSSDFDASYTDMSESGTCGSFRGKLTYRPPFSPRPSLLPPLFFHPLVIVMVGRIF